MEEEVAQTDRVVWKEGWSQSRAGNSRCLQDTPPEKVRRLSSVKQGRAEVRGEASPKRSAARKFPGFGSGGEQVWLLAARTSCALATKIMYHD
jgi:hypothetical protein